MSENYTSLREWTTVICSNCKKECQVPFKPIGTRPVFCKDCFRKHKSGELNKEEF